MSTKIYGGLKIKAESLDEVMSLVIEKKPILQKMSKEQSLRSDFYSCVNLLVNSLLYKENILETYFGIKIEQEEKEFADNRSILSQVERNRTQDKDEDETWSLIVFTEKVAVNNEIHYLALMFVPNMSSREVNAEMSDIVTEYGYWDNTEKIEKVSDEEWSEREKNWEKVLTAKSGIPSLEGISIVLAQANPYISQHERKERIKSFLEELEDFEFSYGDKVTDMLTNILIDKSTDKSTDNSTDNSNDKKWTTSNILKMRSRIKKGELSDEEKVWQEKLDEIIHKVLPEKITLDLLITPFKDVVESMNKRKLNIELENSLGVKSNKNKIKI